MLIHTISGRATSRGRRLGSLIVRYSHSSPARCIQTGARRLRPEMTSRLPPTPMQIGTPNSSKCFLIHFS